MTRSTLSLVTRMLGLVLAATLFPSCASGGNGGRGLVIAPTTVPVIGANQAGDAIVMWISESYSDQGFIVEGPAYFNLYQPGIGWTPSIQTFADPSTDFFPYAAGLDSQQNVLAVGVDSLGNFASVQYSPGSPGFQAPVPIAPSGSGNDLSGSPTVPVFAMNEQGQAVLLWTQTVDPTQASRLMAAQFTPGTGWSAAVSIESVSLPGATLVTNGSPQVALDGLGNAVVVWLATGFTAPVTFVGQQLWTNSLTAGSGWNVASSLSGFSASGFKVPQFAGSAGTNGNPGGAMALWTENSPTLWMSQFSPAAGWSAPEDVTSFIPYSTFSGILLRMDPAGDAMVLSSTRSTAPVGAASQVWVNYYSASSGKINAPPGWGPPLPIAVGECSEVGIAMNPSGKAIVLVFADVAGGFALSYFDPSLVEWQALSPSPLDLANPGPANALTYGESGPLGVVWGQGILVCDFSGPPVQLVQLMVPPPRNIGP